MTSKVLYYKKGYRYQSIEDYEQDVGIDGIFPVKPGGNDFATLTIDGKLHVRKWYAWNGANKPAINDKTFVLPSFVHDVHCQLWALGVIDDVGRAASDRLLGKMLKEATLKIANRNPWYIRWPLKIVAHTRPLWVEGSVSWFSRHFAVAIPEEILTAP